MRRLLGSGYEPHVYEDGDRLIYQQPVASGHADLEFTFEVARRDVDVLLADPYRRAVLEMVGHTVLQRSGMRGADPVTQADFDALVARVLHSDASALERYIEQAGRDYHTAFRVYIDQALARWSIKAPEAARDSAGSPSDPPLNDAPRWALRRERALKVDPNTVVLLKVVIVVALLAVLWTVVRRLIGA